MRTDRATTKGWFDWALPALFFGHLLIAGGLMGFSLRLLLLDGAYLAFALAGKEPRRIAKLALPLWIVLVAYFDILPFALQYRGDIHVADLYAADLRWFGINTASGRITLPEFFADHHWPWLDMICGLVYMAEIPQVAPFVLYLYFRDQRRLVCLMWTGMLTHLAAFTIWVIYPAAPPWYVVRYGLGPAVLDAASSPAGLSRIDDYLGLPLIQGFYSQSVNVFGAMPSLHVALPTVVACVAAGMGRAWFIPSLLFAMTMAFGAAYSQHHYVLDAIAGFLCATISFALVSAFMRPRVAAAEETVAVAAAA